MDLKEWNELEKKEKLLKQAAAVLRVEEKDLPRVVDRFLKEIEEMSNESLVEAFEFNVRHGAGHNHRSVVFMKREVLKRMNKKDSDKI